MKTIERTEYLNRIKNLKDTPDIKVITGIRRSGKSILMQEYIQYLKDNFNDINVIFIDFMDLSFEHLKEYHALHAYLFSMISSATISVARNILKAQKSSI